MQGLVSYVLSSISGGKNVLHHVIRYYTITRLPLLFQTISSTASTTFKMLLVEQNTFFFESMMLSGEEVHSYFTHRTTGTSLTNIPRPYTTFSQPYFRLKACAVVNSESSLRGHFIFFINISCRFRDRCRKYFASRF